MTILWFDCETYSECDLKAHGTHRYAEHESTEITVAQWAIDDGMPYVWDCTAPKPAKRGPLDYLRDQLNDPNVTVIAHNSMFDRTVLRHCWDVDIPVERWQDTMIQAMAHGLPGSLDKIGQIVGLEADQAKDKRGRDLIQLFCKPRAKNSTLRRATRETHTKEWAEFLEYSRQDIVAMRAISKRLPTWNYRTGHPELALWHLDQRINDRGFEADASGIYNVAKENANMKSFGDQLFYKGSVGFSAGAEWNFAGSTSLVPEIGFFYGLTPLHFRAIKDNYTLANSSGEYFYQKARQNQLIVKLSILF